MASLLDFLGGQNLGGLLGSLGGEVFYDPLTGHPMPRPPVFSEPPVPANMDAQSSVARDPFNFVMPGVNSVGPAGAPMQPPMPPTAVPPQARMPVSLPQQSPSLPPAPPPAPVHAAPVPLDNSPGFGDRLNAGFMGFANSGAPLPALANLISGLATGQRSDPQGVAQQQQTLTAKALYNALVQKGHTPQQAMGMAMSAAGNPAIAQSILPEAFSAKPLTNLKIGDLEIPLRAGEGGKLEMMLPGGGSANSLNDLLAWKDARDAENARAKAEAQKIGEGQGNAREELPAAKGSAEETLKLIQELRNHPGKNLATGPLAGHLPAITGDQADYVSRLEQLGDQAMAIGIGANKGGGLRITQAEATAFKNAAARLKNARVMNEEGRNAALQDYENLVRRNYKALSERAGVTSAPLSTPQSSAGLPQGWSVTVR